MPAGSWRVPIFLKNHPSYSECNPKHGNNPTKPTNRIVQSLELVSNHFARLYEPFSTCAFLGISNIEFFPTPYRNTHECASSALCCSNADAPSESSTHIYPSLLEIRKFSCKYARCLHSIHCSKVLLHPSSLFCSQERDPEKAQTKRSVTLVAQSNVRQLGI